MIAYIASYVIVYILAGFVVRGSGFEAVEEKSSPSHIVATKGSSVWLHWNYSYTGDEIYGHILFMYRYQTIGFQALMQSTFHTLAKRIGQDGVLTSESPVPAPFNGRVEVMSSNSTLVIHNLQYNDSAYQFSSLVTRYIEVFRYRSGKDVTSRLKPIVRITVNGT